MPHGGRSQKDGVLGSPSLLKAECFGVVNRGASRAYAPVIAAPLQIRGTSDVIDQSILPSNAIMNRINLGRGHPSEYCDNTIYPLWPYIGQFDAQASSRRKSHGLVLLGLVSFEAIAPSLHVYCRSNVSILYLLWSGVFCIYRVVDWGAWCRSAAVQGRRCQVSASSRQYTQQVRASL